MPDLCQTWHRYGPVLHFLMWAMSGKHDLGHITCTDMAQTWPICPMLIGMAGRAILLVPKDGPNEISQIIAKT